MLLEKFLELPGNPERLRTAAAGHRAMGESLSAIATRIKGTDTTDLTGSSADAARRKLQDVVAGLQDQADQHTDAATKMSADADAMDEKRQSTIKAIEGLAAGIVAATVVGVALTWLTVGISDLLAEAAVESAFAAATVMVIEYAAWLDSFVGGMVWIYTNAVALAFTFQVFSELAGGKPVLGGPNEAGNIFGNALGIALGNKFGALTGGALAGAGVRPLLSAAGGGAAGGVFTGAFNSTAVVGMTGGHVDPATVAESAALAGVLGGLAGPLLPARQPVVTAEPGAGSVPGGAAVGGGVFYDPAVAVDAGAIEMVPLPAAGGGAGNVPGGAAVGGGVFYDPALPGNAGPATGGGAGGSEAGPSGADAGSGAGSAEGAGNGPGGIPSGGAAGDTPGGGARGDTSPGSVASDTASTQYSDAVSQVDDSGSDAGDASSAGALPVGGLAGATGSGSPTAASSNPTFYSIDEQDLAGFAIA